MVRPETPLRLLALEDALNPKAAARAVRALVAAPTRLLAQPRIGEILEEFDPREVRRILVGRYELRYEVRQKTIYVLRIRARRSSRAS